MEDRCVRNYILSDAVMVRRQKIWISLNKSQMDFEIEGPHASIICDSGMDV